MSEKRPDEKAKQAAAALDIFATGGAAPPPSVAPKLGPASPGPEGPLGSDLFLTGGGPGSPEVQASEAPSEALVAGRYQILRELGRGGMGRVFLARDSQNQELLALKTLEAHLQDTEWREQWLQELQIHSRLHHPHIAPMRRLEKDAQLGFFVTMDYVEGEDLEHFYRAGKASEHPLPFALETTRKLLSQIAEALDHAHEQGVVHLDIKPSNVLLQKPSCPSQEYGQGELRGFTFEAAKLIDFGIARLRAGDAGGQVLGTVYYMAPEQLSGSGALTPAADIYALGVLSYQLLTGEIFQGGMPGPSKLNRALPSAVDGVFEQAVAYRPQERFASAGAFVQAFEQALMLEESGVALEHGAPSAAAPARGVRRVVLREKSDEPTASERHWPQIKERIESKRPSWLQTPFVRKAPRVVPASQCSDEDLESLPVAPLAESLIVLDRGGRALLELCPIPGGTFTMGAERSDRSARRPEKPQANVQLSAFALARTPICRGMWKVFLEESRYEPVDAHAEYMRGYGEYAPMLPMAYISLIDAWAFCDFYGLSLPSEAQWEYGARGDDGRPYPWGDAAPIPNQPETMVAHIGQPQMTEYPVGARLEGASPFGILDAIGPLRQWVADEYDARWLRSVQRNPDPVLLGKRREGFYSIRGASATTPADQAQVYRRYSAPPDDCLIDVGFRPCLDHAAL